ncbi:hypothetical protein IWW50_003650 [Coemansia erecta]|nr:hypothetical protein IWW50_003650 [Coemansia erecta]
MASDMQSEIQFQLKDAAQGLTYSASSVEFIFADDPTPLGSDDGQMTVVVDMSEDGGKPVGVRSLSSSLMVTDFKWAPRADGDDEATAASLTVEAISLEHTSPVPETQVEKHMGPQSVFNSIQRDSHHLAKRAALLGKALSNLDPAI